MYRSILCAAALCAALTLATPAAAAPEALAGAWALDELAATARLVEPGGRLVVSGVELAPGEPPAALELTRFEVFTPGAVVVVHHDGGEETLPAPRGGAWFRGTVAGDPDSLAVLSVRAAGEEGGAVRGIVQQGGATWVLGARPASAGGAPADLAARAADASEVPGTGAFDCATDELLVPPVRRELAASTTAALPGTSYTAVIAVETDWELYQKFGSTAAATGYVGDLFAYASAIYDAEIATDLQVGHLSLWTTSADPWAQSPGGCGLFEFGQYWNAHRTGVERTLAHFLSGKSTNAGVAWVGVLCNGPFTYNIGSGCPGMAPIDTYGGDYGYSGGLDANFDLDDPSVVWDIVATSHEIGHNFNSPHTHCYNGLGGSSQPVDQCYGSQAGCYAGSGSLPCAAPGAGCGTLMSYCHLRSPGLSNLSLTFGTGHPHGVLPQRVPDRMRAHVEAVAGAAPACLARLAGCSELTLAHDGSGSDPTAVPAASAGCPAGSYVAGETLLLTAAPAAGWHVAGWDGTADDASGFVTNAVSMPAGDHTATAVYAPGCDDLTLDDGTDTATAIYDACGTLTAGDAYAVGATGNVTLRSYQRVVLTDGFRVLDGGRLTVVAP